MEKNKTAKAAFRLSIGGFEIIRFKAAASISIGFVAIVTAVITKMLG